MILNKGPRQLHSRGGDKNNFNRNMIQLKLAEYTKEGSFERFYELGKEFLYGKHLI